MKQVLIVPGAHIAGLIAAGWVAARRRRYRGRGRALSELEHSAMAGYFGNALLASVRVVEVERIEDPLGARVARRLFGGLGRPLAGVRGMAFGDTVVLTRGAWGGPEKISRSVLFHELVHVAQYRELGVRPFLVEYLRGWWDAGREYSAIPLERQAYALQERFDTGSGAFNVEAEVRRLTAGA